MSALARVVLATPPTSPVATPVSQSRIDVTWVAVVGAQAYRVYRNGVLVETTAGTTHSSTGLTASTLYTYQLASVDASTADGPSGAQFSATTQAVPDTTAPTVPTIAVSTGSNTTQTVTLTVASTDAGSGLASYTLDRATNAGFTANLVTQTLATNAFPVAVSGLTAATQYFYRCRATDGANNTSANSTAVNATTSGASNQAPVWASSVDQIVPLSLPMTPLSLDTLCTDPEGQPVTYTIQLGTLPAGLTQSGTRGEIISGTPTIAGASDVVFLANDSAVTDPDSDWLARSTASGVFYKNNFNFANLAALLASNYGTPPNSDRIELETSTVLSGKGCKINVLKDDGEGTGSYRHSWVMPVGSQTKSINKKEFYYQFAMYLPAYILDHRFATLPGTPSNGDQQNHKWLILQEPDLSFGRGEVVIITPFFRKCVGAYTLRGSGVDNGWRFKSGYPSHPGTGTKAFQTIDAGPQSSGGLTDATSDALFKRRYGFWNKTEVGTEDYGSPLSAQGQPDPDSSINGIVWAPDAWNVVEVYVNEATDTVKVWHAVYGDQPRLVISATGSATTGELPGADLGNRAGNYTGAQLLPRLEERDGDATREDTYAIYRELLASDNLINFPGGFTPT